MTLYNLKTDGDHYRITKFDNDLEVESSYLTSESECTCPAGHRPTCRHRQMLPILLAEGICDKPAFYSFEKQEFYWAANQFDEPEITMPSEVESSYELSVPEGTKEVTETQRAMPAEAPLEIESAHPSIGHIKRRV